MEIPLILEMMSLGIQKMPEVIDRETQIIMGRYLEGRNRTGMGLTGLAIAYNPDMLIMGEGVGRQKEIK
jgi:hypothetical protein